MQTRPDTLRLTSGQTLRLLRLTQRDIDATVVEGVPCALVNERIIEEERAAAARESGLVPSVIQPVATPLPNPRGQTDQFAPACIPRVASRAVFRGPPSPAAKAYEEVSELTLFWFQHQFGWPPDEGTLGPLRAVDWGAHATNRVFS